MNSLPALFSRINRIVFVLGIAFLAITPAGVIFVTPSSNDGALTATHLAVPPTDASTKSKIAERFAELPLSFEINKGQTDPAVKFVSHGPGYDLFLTTDEAVLSLRKPQAQTETARTVEGSVIRLKLLGAKAAPHVEGKEALPGKVNYFIGNDRDQWRRDIPTYRKVHYTDVYPGIDIVYYGNQREFEYDFVVAAGANPKLIKFRVEGAGRIHLDQKGNLLLALKHGEVRLNKPFIYQVTDEGSRSEVKGSYVINGKEIRFMVRGADSGKPLVIDPVLSYSTFLGGNLTDQTSGIAVDAQGSAYVTGSTFSNAFPTTPGAFNTSGSDNAFITKLDPTGSSLVYSTFLNGSLSTTGTTAIAVDSAGNAYVTGSTDSTNFPLVNPLKTSGLFFKSTDAALHWNNNNTGLTEALNTLAVAPTSSNTIYAGTFRGSYRSTDAGATWTKSSTDLPSVSAIAVDPTNALVAYAGASGLFKTTDGGNNWNTLNTPLNGAFIRTIVIDPLTPSTIYAGSEFGLFRSTDNGGTWTGLNNFGTSIVPHILSIAIDPTAPSTIYAGTLGHGLFKTTNGGASWTPINNGITSGFGTNPAVVDDVVIDTFNSANLYINVVGTINKSTNGGSSWGTVNNSAVRGGINAMVADRSTPSTLYVGTVGGGVIKTTDGGTSWTGVNTGLWPGIIRVLVSDPSNSTILYAGGSDSNFNRDAFVTKLNSSGSDLLFSTYLGGSANEIGRGIAVDSSGNIYVTGNTNSANFPTQNAFQSAPPSLQDSGGNAFVTKINPAAPSYVFSTYLGGSARDEANGIAIDPAANVYVTGNTVSTDFPTANAFQAILGDPFVGDAFVTKFNSSGSLNYSTYLGGNSTDNGFGIAVDVSGNAYVTGLTRSTNFPVANPIQTAHNFNTGATDAFVTKLNSQGSSLVYSTYLGGTDLDTARGIAVDAAGNAYVTGSSGSFDFPLVAGAIRTTSAVFKSVDDATSWSNDNYGVAGATQLVIDPTQPLRLYAGTGNGMFRSTDGGKTWSPINNGLAARFVVTLIIDPLTPTTLYVTTLDGFGGGADGVYKTTDGGNSWSLRRNGITKTNLPSLAIDPVTPATLYAGAFDGPTIYKTTDGADNWAPIGNPPPFAPSFLAVDPHTPTRIFAADRFGMGGIFRSIDAGATWQSVLSQTNAEGIWVGASPLTPGLVYATLRNSNLTDLGLFKSVDGGDHWTFVRPSRGKIVFDPVSASTLYFLSTTEGLLKSTDNGQTWIPKNNGLPAKSAIELAINPLRTSTLYLATGSSGAGAAYVTKINPAGSALIYSTFLGASGSSDLINEASAIALDSAGNAYVTGSASAPSFPTTPNAYQTVNRGFVDAFIAKLTMSHIISGQVLDAGGTPVNGAEVVLSDGASISAIVTEADGAYEFSHLREGGSFTVSAAKPHSTMAPPSQSFNNLNGNQTLNFTATATNTAFFTISGQVSDNGAGLAGVRVTLTGSQSGVRITDSNGNYSFEVPGDGSYTLTPSVTGFAFTPLSQTFNSLSASPTANFAAARQSIVVTNANNDGIGSLHEAITLTNATFGTDTITFNIPGAGVKAINLSVPLPEITEAVVIDATTQPGYAGTPLVELEGANAGFENGLVITAGNSTVRGLAIGGFQFSGIVLRSCNNNIIQGNYIGTDATGTQQRQNNTGILLSNSSTNVIGGTSAAARNVISGNIKGIEIFGAGNVIQGNFIGTNASGTAAIGNRDLGVTINPDPVFTNNLIGGISAGAGNLISGNSTGIFIQAPGNTIQGNLIGTDITGTNKIGHGDGIHAGAPNTLIGGLTPAAGNIISGNSLGVAFGGAGSKLQGNFIGTDITGTVALGNTFEGVVASDGALIGGTVSGARNVIAGNQQSNILLDFTGSTQGVTVQGNYIGTDVTGTRAILSFTINSGIQITSSNNLIGGLIPEAQNVISGNAVGIQFRSANVGSPQGNVIQGNLIGLNATGTGALSNSQGGIEFSEGSSNVIGGTQSGAANKIAFNDKYGVVVFSRSFQNSIRGNSIFSNNGLGIDLGDQIGVTANDASDSDAGANSLQNFPVLTSMTSVGNSTTIQGSLNSTPNTTFQIDFYSSLALDPSGHGEGALFFNTTSVTTNDSGDATINVTFPVALGTGRVVTATATDSAGNTSEFSAGDVTSATGNAQFSVSAIRLIEDLGLATITVLRKGGSAGNLPVDYSTMDGTATAGQDYTATSGSLTFSSGETSKTFQIPITNDQVTEPDETFKVTLNASNLEFLGAPTTLVVTIQDRSTVPVIIRNSASVIEGNTSSTEALFTFTLSAATGRSVSVNYATVNINATGGVSCSNPGTDYETNSGTISFQPGNTTFTVAVKICGDTSGEGNESFRINLSGASNATVGGSQAVGTITDDDVLDLLLEALDPTVDQAAALDAFFLVRDPFRVVLPDWFMTDSVDRNTRVMFFVRGLQLDPGEPPTAVVVILTAGSSQFGVPAEDVRAVPGVDFTQVVVRLPEGLAAGTCTISIRAHSRTTNIGKIRIAP
jgi:Calx-beta domain/Beta-propeller repeat/Carboxypeptidase regulatory-like domain/CarboxypepD_reg-like domain